MRGRSGWCGRRRGEDWGVGRAGNGLNYVRRVALSLGSRRSRRSMCRIASGVISMLGIYH
jgi:hypothetical protein